MDMGEQNLSGRWSGIFSYPRQLPPTPFDAELREHQGALLGEIFEIGASRRNKGDPMHAMIEGSRSGEAVNFIKIYDDLGRSETPVHYSGSVNSNSTEISGTWTIAGHWSGTFLMIRAKGEEAVVERDVAEPVL